MEINSYLAKSIRKGTTKTLNTYLVNHTRMVINFGMEIGRLIYKPKNKYRQYTETDFFTNLALALCLHDIGKMKSNIQSYLEKGKDVDDEGVEVIQDDIRHNICSWAYIMSRLKNMQTSRYLAVASAILYHHPCNAKDKRSNDILNSIDKDTLADMDSFYEQMKNYCIATFNSVDFSNPNFEPQIYDSHLDIPEHYINEMYIYKRISINDKKSISESFEGESEHALIRAILILADRLISSGKCDLERIYNNDTDYIDSLYDAMSTSGFVDDVDMYQFNYKKDRLESQYKLLAQTEQNNHNIVRACAGYGKTLLGLMWFFKWKKRVLWIVPRNIIVTGTYMSIIRELTKMGLNDRVKVGAYFSGNITDCNSNIENPKPEDFDILVTNIDSVISRTTNNSMAHLLVNMYTCNVIFDEYHEFRCVEPLFSAFIRLVRTRSQYTDSKTLMLSATASDFDCLWGMGIVNRLPSPKILHGDTKIRIVYHKFGENEQILIPQNEDDVFVICRTVQDAQKAFLTNKREGAKLLHARFTDDDRKNITTSIFVTHGASDDQTAISQRKMVVGTNIIGTGLDISCKYLYDFVICPEFTIQRCCGRSSRFGEYDIIEYHVCDIDQKRISKVITDEYDAKLYHAWMEELSKLNGQVITKNELYDIYERFNETHRAKVERMYINLFNESSDTLTQMKLKKGGHSKSDKSKHIPQTLGYRGLSNSIFVTAKNTATEGWCKAINVDFDTIYNSEDGEGEHIKDVENFMFKDGYKNEGMGSIFEYPEWNKEKWRLGVKKFHPETCKVIAKCNKSPFPLFDFGYNSELGLFNKQLLV